MGGIPDHQSIIGYILGDHRPCADKGKAADGNPADDGAVGAQSGPFLHQRGSNLVHFAQVCPWVVDVGKHHGRPAKNTIFEGYTLEYTDIILNFAFAADDHIGTDDHILANIALGADPRTSQHMRKVPNPGSAGRFRFCHR